VNVAPRGLSVGAAWVTLVRISTALVDRGRPVAWRSERRPWEGQRVFVQLTSHRRSLSISTVALAAGLVVGSLGPGMTAAAAQATPAAAERRLCRVEPATADRFLAALDAAAATAATPGPLQRLTLETLPAGEPADSATVEGVTVTVQTALECRNLGDFARVYALFSDRLIGQIYGGRETVPPEIRQILQEPQRQVRPPFWVNLIELSDVRLLPDGRVGAVVVTANATHSFTDYLFFVNEDGAWLIDQAMPIATTATATPAATPAP
jgi:hypothetical protein